MKTFTTLLSLSLAAASAQAGLLPRQDSFPSGITCANVRCASGTICDDASGTAKCVKPELTCATVNCLSGTYCVEQAGRPVCVPVVTTTVASFTTLDAAAVGARQAVPTTFTSAIRDACSYVRCAYGCQVAPNGAAQCVNPCADISCVATHTCQVNKLGQGECVPIPTEAEAVKARQEQGEACGVNTCGATEFCCNSSCGICAPKDGGMCIQQACEVPSLTSSLSGYPTTTP